MSILQPGASAIDAGPPIEMRLREAGLPSLGTPAWVEVDLDALEANARLVRRLLPDGGLLGIVVKAHGYGHGLEMAALAARDGGADWLIVATVDEAANLRTAGLSLPILSTYPAPVDCLDVAAELGLTVVAGSADSVEALVAAKTAARARPGAAPLRVHLEIDTGMTRGGVLPVDAVAAARRLASTPGVVLGGAWTHLRSPEDPAACAVQVSRFEAATADLIAAGIPVPLRHVVSTDGLLGGTCPAFDMARIGYAFYGGTDTAPAPSGIAAEVAAALRPALSIKARAVGLEVVPVGAEVGYGGVWRAERPSVIATLPIGYGDGWIRSTSPGAHVLVRGRRVPLVGRVSMDAIGVDVTGAGPVGPADEFVVVGSQGGTAISLAEVAAVRGSISREVLTLLGPRLPRVYVRGDRPVALATLPASRIVRAAGT